MIQFFYSLFNGSSDHLSLLFRSIGGALTASILFMVCAPVFIRFARRRGLCEQARNYAGLAASGKAGTPTSGGLLIYASVLVAALMWCRLDSAFIVIPLAAGLMCGTIGLTDDLQKIRGGSSDTGVSRGVKCAVQIAIGVAVAGLLFWEATSPVEHAVVRQSLYLPFLRGGLYLGAFYIIIIVGFFVAASNAVNLTDGMDGLAIVPTVFVAVVLGAFAYITGRVDYAEYLSYFPVEVSPGSIEYGLRGAGELTVLCSAIMGAGVGFLWFNAHPASLFMGDTGSMALGGLLGSIAILSKQEAIFVIAGGLFLLEIGSSFIQDYIGLRVLGRRIFFRAPLHHNMLHKGVAETKVTVRLWIIAAFFAVLALCTLKLR